MYNYHLSHHKDNTAKQQQQQQQSLYLNISRVPIFVFSTTSGWTVPYGFHISGPVTNRRGLMCNYVFSDSSMKHPGLFYMEASGSHVYSGYSVVIDNCIPLLKSQLHRCELLPSYTDKICIWKILTSTPYMNISISYTCAHTQHFHYNISISCSVFQLLNRCMSASLSLFMFVYTMTSVLDCKLKEGSDHVNLILCRQCPVEHNSLSNAC